jgi:hypothetical protein
MKWTAEKSYLKKFSFYPVNVPEKGLIELSVKQIIDYAGFALEVFLTDARNQKLETVEHVEYISDSLQTLGHILPKAIDRKNYQTTETGLQLNIEDAIERALTGTVSTQDAINLLSEPEKIVKTALNFFESVPNIYATQTAFESWSKRISEDYLLKHLLEDNGNEMLKALRFAEKQFTQRGKIDLEEKSKSSDDLPGLN